MGLEVSVPVWAALIGGLTGIFARRTKRKESDKASSIQQHLRAIRHAENLDRQTHFRRSQVQRLIQRFDSSLASEANLHLDSTTSTSDNQVTRTASFTANTLNRDLNSYHLRHPENWWQRQEADQLLMILGQLLGSECLWRLATILKCNRTQPEPRDVSGTHLAESSYASTSSCHRPLDFSSPTDRRTGFAILRFLEQVAKKSIFLLNQRQLFLRIPTSTSLDFKAASISSVKRRSFIGSSQVNGQELSVVYEPDLLALEETIASLASGQDPREWPLLESIKSISNTHLSSSLGSSASSSSDSTPSSLSLAIVNNRPASGLQARDDSLCKSSAPTNASVSTVTTLRSELNAGDNQRKAMDHSDDIAISGKARDHQRNKGTRNLSMLGETELKDSHLAKNWMADVKVDICARPSGSGQFQGGDVSEWHEDHGQDPIGRALESIMGKKMARSSVMVEANKLKQSLQRTADTFINRNESNLCLRPDVISTQADDLQVEGSFLPKFLPTNGSNSNESDLIKIHQTNVCVGQPLTCRPTTDSCPPAKLSTADIRPPNIIFTPQAHDEPTGSWQVIQAKCISSGQAGKLATPDKSSRVYLRLDELQKTNGESNKSASNQRVTNRIRCSSPSPRSSLEVGSSNCGHSGRDKLRDEKEECRVNDEESNGWCKHHRRHHHNSCYKCHRCYHRTMSSTQSPHDPSRQTDDCPSDRQNCCTRSYRHRDSRCVRSTCCCLCESRHRLSRRSRASRSNDELANNEHHGHSSGSRSSGRNRDHSDAARPRSASSNTRLKDISCVCPQPAVNNSTNATTTTGDRAPPVSKDQP